MAISRSFVSLRSLGASVLTLFLALSPTVRADQTTGCPTTPPATQDLPRNYGMILYQGLTMLDVFGPLEALQQLSYVHKLNLYLISDNLDTVTSEVPATENPLHSHFFTNLKPTHTFATVPSDLEVLMIPGGAGPVGGLRALNSTVDFIRTTYPKLRYLITICVGSGLAAQAGVLDGKRATTHKGAWSTIVPLGPNVTWVHKARWVEDGNIWTSSGVSAGIDVTFAFIQKIYGAENATAVANGIEYDRHMDPDWDPFSDIFPISNSTS